MYTLYPYPGVLQNAALDITSDLPVPSGTQTWIHEPSNSLTLLGDFHANYNTFPYSVVPNVEIVIKGQFPFARYLSFSVIGNADLTIATVPDYALLPDPGNTNPFLPGEDWNAKNRSYTLKIRFTAPPENSAHFVPEAGNNIVYAGTMPWGEPNIQGTIGLRIYAPSIGYNATGGVGYPEITYQSVPINNLNLQLSNSIQPSAKEKPHTPFYTSQEGACALSWSTLDRKSALIQYDYNDAYIISSELIRSSDKLLYLRWKAPSFPNTYHNIGISGMEDMRYWSMSFVSPVGLIGLYTLADFETVTDKNGYVNLIISFGAPRPSLVTTENGFNWIDVNHLPLVPLQLFYRNKIISDSFPYSAKNLESGSIVTSSNMGDYYPCGNYILPESLSM